jgi:hypothetical protein
MTDRKVRKANNRTNLKENQTMLRYIKIAFVVAAMTFIGISPAFADTPIGTGPASPVNTVSTQSDTVFPDSTAGSEFGAGSGSAEAFYTMPNGSVELGVQNADGSWSAPTD